MPRQLKCPRCATVNTIADGAKPACANCGFGSKAAPPPGSSGASFSRINPPLAPVAAPASRLSPIAIGAMAAFAVAILLGILIQLPALPWSTSHLEVSAGGATTVMEAEYAMWGGSSKDAGPAANGTADPDDSSSYWGSDTDELAGIWLMRAGAPLLCLALALCVAATACIAAGKRGVANNLAWGALSVGASSVIVFALGLWQHQEEVRASFVGPAGASGSLEFAWGISFYLGIACVIVMAVAAYLNSMRDPALSAAAKPSPPA